MLFTAPAFMFVFLPFALLFCVMFGKNRKKLCLTAVCAAFYVLLNLTTPLNLLWLLLLVVYAYFAAQLVTLKQRKIFNTLLGAIPLVWLVLMRQVAYFGVDVYPYPVAMTLPAICSAAYVWDVAYGEKPERKISDLWLYLTFFPIMIIGPFLTYSEFSHLVEDDKLNISLERVSSGVRMFAVGFIKMIAVGAVFIEGYSKIFAYSWESPNLAIILFLFILIYFGVFFSVSGYYDMSCGVAWMLGVDVPTIKANPLKVATVNEYSKTLFGNVRTWSNRYIVRPIGIARQKESSGALKIVACCITTVVFLRSEPIMLLLCIPLIAFAFASSCLKLDKSYKKGRTGIRTLFAMLTIMVIGAFWMFVTMSGGTPSVFDYIGEAGFDNAEYQTDMVLLSFSGIKYAFVALIGLLLLAPQTNWIERCYESASERARAVVDYSSMILLLALFIFTAVFFLPQFSFYNYAPFRYIII